MDLSQTCRSCMKKISLRRKRTDNAKTVEMFSLCLNVEISDEDNLPKQFCSICVNKIESSYAFITQAQKVDLTLRNLLSRAETSVIVKPEHNKNSIEINPVKFETSLQEKKISENYALEDDFVQAKISTPEIHDSINDSGLLDSRSFYHDEDVLSGDGIEESEFISEVVAKKLEKKKNVCPFCPKKFGSKLWFYKHLKNEHSKKSYNCKTCSKSFTEQSKWRRHLYVHSTERKFSCAECGRRYKHRKQLADHMRNHGDCKPFVCDICSKSFKRKSVLLYHMRFHQDKTYLCNVCGMSFAGNSNLVTHMRVHTGEKPFECGECSKAFNTSSSLRRHERLHRGEAPHACDCCQKAFSCLASLIRHRRTHTGEQPYQCPWCPRGFVDSWKRKVHLMRMHGAGLSDIPRLARDGSLAPHRGRPVLCRPLSPTASLRCDALTSATEVKGEFGAS